MSLHMDFTRRIVIDSNGLDWEASRMPGVERRKLEREFPESGRATSLVRYAPDSHFSGSYVRNPIGSTHQPHSDGGCIIFVKLDQFDAQDTDFVRIGTSDAPWQPGMVDGLSVMPLHEFGTESVALVKWAPGCRFTRHVHMGGEEILVLDGVFEDEHGRYPRGTWIRSPHGSAHTPFSTEGCTIWVKTGHLAPEAT